MGTRGAPKPRPVVLPRPKANKKIPLALEIIAGLKPAHRYWVDFLSAKDYPERDPQNESMQEHVNKAARMVKQAAVDYISGFFPE